MKKIFVLLLAVIVVVSGIFVSCSKKDASDEDVSAVSDLENNDTEFGVETDENGNEVDVVYEYDKKGNKVAHVVDKDGNKTGVTVKIKDSGSSNNKGGNNDNNDSNNNNSDNNEEPLKPNPTREHGSPNIGKDVPLTSEADTTKFDGKDEVPKTSATGKEVRFSDEDYAIIENMLEVPYLYTASYENSEGVPLSIATHTAVWMAEHEGSTRRVYPSSPVVLNLFRFYGQTVINFKTQCNDFAKDTKAPITYSEKDDTFTITEFTKRKQTVQITKVEDLGNNNYYKVTGKVSGCSKKTVVAIVQKNKLDISLGFSIKALKWS